MYSSLTPYFLFSLGALLSSAAAEGIEFAYSPGPQDPLHWNTLAGSELCAATNSSTRQSPINLSPAVPVVSSVQLHYTCGAAAAPRIRQRREEAQASDWTRTIAEHKLEYAPPAAEQLFASLAGDDYDLLQFHFHTPSEHRFNGDRRVLETHFVGKKRNGMHAGGEEAGAGNRLMG